MAPSTSLSTNPIHVFTHFATVHDYGDQRNAFWARLQPHLPLPDVPCVYLFQIPLVAVILRVSHTPCTCPFPTHVDVPCSTGNGQVHQRSVFFTSRRCVSIWSRSHRASSPAHWTSPANRTDFRACTSLSSLVRYEYIHRWLYRVFHSFRAGSVFQYIAPVVFFLYPPLIRRPASPSLVGSHIPVSSLSRSIINCFLLAPPPPHQDMSMYKTSLKDRIAEWHSAVTAADVRWLIVHITTRSIKVCPPCSGSLHIADRARS